MTSHEPNSRDSGTTPGTSRNMFGKNQVKNEDDSQSNPHPEVFNSGRGDRHDMVTGVHEKVTYCSPSTSSGKQKKNRSTSQPQFRSENTPATIEADQFLLALQQLANNNNSASFHNNNNRISKLPKSLTTTMPTFDGKSELFSGKAPKSSDVVFSFLLFLPFPGEKHSCLHAKSRYK